MEYNNNILVIDFEQYAASRGLSIYDLGEAGLHKSHSRISKKKWERMIKDQYYRDMLKIEKRDTLREEYDKLVGEGKIRPRTKKERLIDMANGHPDKESVQAARRLVKKYYGIIVY